MKILKFTNRLCPDWINYLTTRVPDPRIKLKSKYTMEQVLFTGLMVFMLRYRSLRSFCMENKDNAETLKNFGHWITINEIPGDDGLRYGLQAVRTENLNNILKDFHQRLERQKILVSEKLFNKHELVCLDGTGHLSSQNTSCEKCLTKTLENGNIIYYHGQLLASLTNLNANYALPLQFEPIERDDVDTEYSKNDCELNAGKRLLQKLKVQFPKRNFCILADNLFCAESILLLIRERAWHFIITAKPERNKELFLMSEFTKERRQSAEWVDSKGNHHFYQWNNKLPLKQYLHYEDMYFVNLIEYIEANPDGEIVYSSAWMTDFEVTKDNVRKIASAGRARFTIENRNFNEQKNLGFHTEHNFGHFGNLPNVFFGLAQIAQLITELFSFWKGGKLEIDKVGSKRRYVERLAVIVGSLVIPDDELPILYLKFYFNSS